MSWITLTQDDLENHLTGDELEALTTEALAVDQDNPVPDVITEITREVRGYVAAKNTLGPAGMVPDECKRSALNIIRWAVINRLPGMKFLASEERKAEYDDAKQFLRDVGRGTVKIEQPATASDEVTGTEGVSVVSPRTKKASQSELDGL